MKHSHFVSHTTENRPDRRFFFCLFFASQSFKGPQRYAAGLNLVNLKSRCHFSGKYFTGHLRFRMTDY